MADELLISQSELSKIENGKTQKIDFMFMSRVCDYFDKNFEYFTEINNQTNNIKQLNGSVNNYGTINLTPEDILQQIKLMIIESQKPKN